MGLNAKTQLMQSCHVDKKNADKAPWTYGALFDKLGDLEIYFLCS